MQGFQADAEDFCGSGFIVSGSLKCLENQELLCFFDRGPDSQPDGIGVAGGGMKGGLPEAGGQMPSLDDWTFADNHRPFQSIAQFTNVSRPGKVLEGVQHG